MALLKKIRSISNRCWRAPGKIGLALGSGGARGYAHIGVIQALLESDLPIACVAGTSMGALVGMVFASGRLASLNEFASGMDWRQGLYYFAEASFVPRAGLIDGRRIASFLRNYVAAENIENLPLPFAACATDLMTGRETVLDRGDIVEAVRASISIPGVFTPVRRAGRILVDGGLVNPVPINLVRAMGAETVIAVDVNHLGEPLPGMRLPPAAKKPESNSANRAPPMPAGIRSMLERISLPPRGDRFKRSLSNPSIFDVLGNSIRIMEAQITETRFKIEPPDILIRPRLRNVLMFDFHRAKEIIAEGRAAARATLETLRT